MDIRLFWQVVRRRRVIALSGLTLGVALAVLSLLRPSFEDGGLALSYRQSEEWTSESRLLVTERGFSWGNVDTNPEKQEVERRLTQLAIIYAGFATSDEVMQLIRSSGPVRGKIFAYAVTTADDEQILPVLGITARTTGGGDAQDLANRAAAAIQTFVAEQQAANGIPENERVELQVLNRAGIPVLVVPRSKTLPVVVLLTVLLATIGICFILENVRQSAVPARDAAEPVLEPRQERVVMVQEEQRARKARPPSSRRRRAG
jgi:hypothetical protein